MSAILEMNKSVAGSALTRGSAYVELIRPRIAVLVLVVTSLGFFLAIPAGQQLFSLAALLHTLLGTAMVAAGANALNQFLEAEHDRRMTRTMNRPIPSARLSSEEALCFGLTSGISTFVSSRYPSTD